MIWCNSCLTDSFVKLKMCMIGQCQKAVPDRSWLARFTSHASTAVKCCVSSSNLKRIPYKPLTEISWLTEDSFSVNSICSLGSSVNISAMWRFPVRAEQPHRSNRCRARAKLRTTWLWATLGCLDPSLPFLWHQLLSFPPRQIPRHQHGGDTSIPCMPVVSSMVCGIALMVFHKCLRGVLGGSVEPLITHQWNLSLFMVHSGLLGLRICNHNLKWPCQCPQSSPGAQLSNRKSALVNRAENWK